MITLQRYNICIAVVKFCKGFFRTFFIAKGIFIFAFAIGRNRLHDALQGGYKRPKQLSGMRVNASILCNNNLLYIDISII